MSHQKRIIWLTIFSIAMGFLEAAVVVYLRELYYPEGFNFPLTSMDIHVALTEIGREAATVIMLLGVGMLGGKTPYQRFSFFIASFAIWDIFYYVFLKIILDWPASLLTWDILFLIPVPWVGPVITPVLISITMLILAWAINVRCLQEVSHSVSRQEWLILITGSLLVVGSWTIDYITFSMQRSDSLLAFSSYIPKNYNWFVFAMGEFTLLFAIYKFWIRTKTK
ncbi:MAG: hypothetical protein HC811_04040 [Flammeovirgaceae bacterium]|nr:hypothetical protein [Flammeovirgaceae bacterium]